MDRGIAFGADITPVVDRITQYVHDSAQRFLTDRYTNRVTGVLYLHPPAQTVCRTQCNGTHNAIAKLLLDFQGQIGLTQLQRIVDFWNGIAWKFHVDNRTDNFDYVSGSGTHDCILITYLNSVLQARPRQRHRRFPRFPG